MSNSNNKKVPYHLLDQIHIGLSQDYSQAYYEFIGSEQQAKMMASHLRDTNLLTAQYDQGMESETESNDAEIASVKKELFISKLEVNRLLAENTKLKKEKLILHLVQKGQLTKIRAVYAVPLTLLCVEIMTLWPLFRHIQAQCNGFVAYGYETFKSEIQYVYSRMSKYRFDISLDSDRFQTV